MDKEILDERLVPLAEVQRILEEREKIGDLNYTQRITLDHAHKFNKISVERAYTLINILTSEFNIHEGLAVQIVNIMPKHLDEIQPFFSGQKVTGPKSNDELVLILKTLMEFVFSALIDQVTGLDEKKVIRLLLEKPRSVEETIKALSLRGEGKEAKGKEIFALYLKNQLVADLIVDHFLLPAQAVELTQKMPRTLKETQDIFGEALSEKDVGEVSNRVELCRKIIGLTTDFQVPLSISQMVAESNPVSLEDLKKQLGAVGESFTEDQLKAIQTTLSPQE